MTTGLSLDAPPRRDRIADKTLRWTTLVLVGVVWVSAAIFGAYILAAYFGSAAAGSLSLWNRAQPNLYEPGTPLATVGIGAHFAAGAILLVLGPIQLVGALRRRAPKLHRWTGRIYLLSALAAGLGGLVFIAIRGTVGGPPMTIGFAVYGGLMILTAVMAYHHARAGRFELHRAWAIRVFSLALGSWLYRMEYAVWFLVFHGGHTKSFDGPLDVFMDFFFYVPNLVVAEAFIRRQDPRFSAGLKASFSVGMSLAAAFLAAATVRFTAWMWGPEILRRVGLL